MSYNTLGLETTEVSSNITSGSSFTWNHLVGSLSDKLLIVCVSAHLSNSSGSIAVTYKGTSMSSAVTRSADTYRSQIFYMLNPPSGNNAVVVSVSAGTFSNAKASSLSFYNCAQSIHATASQASSETNPWGFSITTTIAGGYIIDCLMHTADNNWDAHTPQIELYDYKPESYIYLGSSYRSYTTAGSYEMSWDRMDGTDNRAGYGTIIAIVPSTQKEINKSETVSISESISRMEQSYINELENIRVSDTINSCLTYLINTQDNFSITENTEGNIREGLSISIWQEDIFLEDIPEFPGPRSIILEQSINISERVTVKINVQSLDTKPKIKSINYNIRIDSDKNTKPVIKAEY